MKSGRDLPEFLWNVLGPFSGSKSEPTCNQEAEKQPVHFFETMVNFY
jgi:hypothetical protein